MTEALQTIFGQATKQDDNLSPKQQAVLAASLELFAKKRL